MPETTTATDGDSSFQMERVTEVAPPLPAESSRDNVDDFFQGLGKQVAVVDPSEPSDIQVAVGTNIQTPENSPAQDAQDASTLEGEIIPSESELLESVNLMMTRPGEFTPEQAENLVARCLGGRNIDTLRNENPNLAAALEKMALEQQQTAKRRTIALTEMLERSRQEELAGDQPRDNGTSILTTQEVNNLLADTSNNKVLTITGANIKNVEILPEEIMKLTVTDETGKEREVTTSGLAFLALMVLMDLSLFGGHNTLMMLDKIMDPLVDDQLRGTLGKLGFDIPKEKREKWNAMSTLLENLTSSRVIEMFEEFPAFGTETFQFLQGMKRGDRERMMSGGVFGGKRRHFLKPYQIEMILSKLTMAQRQELHIDVAKPPASVTQEPAAAAQPHSPTSQH